MQAFFYNFLFLFSTWFSPLISRFFCAQKIIQFFQTSVNFPQTAIPLGIIVAPAPKGIFAAAFPALHHSPSTPLSSVTILYEERQKGEPEADCQMTPENDLRVI